MKLVLANDNVLHQITAQRLDIDAELRRRAICMMNMIVFNTNYTFDLLELRKRHRHDRHNNRPSDEPTREIP
jgi:hypothetical protein